MGEYENISDEDLQAQLDAAYQDRTDLEEQRQQTRKQQIVNSELIAALEQEQTSRRKAGFVTGNIGGTQN